MIESSEALVETPHGRIYVECEGIYPAAPWCWRPAAPGSGHDHYHPWFSRLAGDAAVVYFDYSGLWSLRPAA